MIKEFSGTLTISHLVSPGDRVLVALSGGPDSVALLHLFHAVSERLGLCLFAAHLDHGIRPESAEDAAFVTKKCASLGIPLWMERRNIPEIARMHRQGLEEAGREQRMDFLLGIAQRQRCNVIALGHHRADQAETFLHRLMRGSGLSGLAAMRLRRGPFIRPLLSFSREQILDFLNEKQLDFLEDASNRERHYTRNRIRLDLLPLMREFNPRVEEGIAALCSKIGLEEEYWEEEVTKALDNLRFSESQSEAWLSRSRLLALHPALRARVLRRALGDIRGQLAGICALHLDSVDELLLSGPSQGEVHLPGAWVARRYDRLWLRSTPPDPLEPWSFSIEGPGEWALVDGRLIRVVILEHPLGENENSVEFDYDRISFPLTIRTFSPGDRFNPQGGAGSGKLKKFFIDAKIDRETRQTVPLVVGEEIMWVVGIRRCAGKHANAVSRRVLRMEVLSGRAPERCR